MILTSWSEVDHTTHSLFLQVSINAKVLISKGNRCTAVSNVFVRPVLTKFNIRCMVVNNRHY